MEEEIKEHVFTSGEAALIYLKKNFFDKKFFHIGPQEILIYLRILRKISLKKLKKVNIFCAQAYLMNTMKIWFITKIYLKKIQKKR